MLITKKSRISGIEHTREVAVDPDAYEIWKRGIGCVQDVFPHLSAEDREFLITGITPEEWDAIFFGDTEEEDIDGMVADPEFDIINDLLEDPAPPRVTLADIVLPDAKEKKE